MRTFFFLTGFLFTQQFACIAQAAQEEFNFVFVGSTTSSAYLGVQQGIKEANLQGQFLGQLYKLQDFAKIEDLPAQLGSSLAFFVETNKTQLLSLRTAFPEYPVFNLALEDDDLRSACLGNVLHVNTSRKMKQDAAAQWKKKNPGSDVLAQTWHGDFVKFAARDLNKRFRKGFGKTMDEHAWAGWAAVKMSSDAIARNNISDAPTLLKYLKDDLAFDGQKGINMNFRETGQLRQPLLIVEGDKLLGEAPVRGVSSDIDSLGVAGCDK